eukprot:5921827-Lingulodinium_polyedra.AAC.1
MDWEYLATQVGTEGSATWSLAFCGKRELVRALGPMLKPPRMRTGSLRKEAMAPAALSNSMLRAPNPSPV